MAPYSLSGVFQISRSLKIPNWLGKKKQYLTFQANVFTVAARLNTLAWALSELGARSPVEAVIWEIAISASHTHTPRKLRLI